MRPDSDQLTLVEPAEIEAEAGIWKLAEERPAASFHRFFLEDINPVSGQQSRREIWAPNDDMRAVHRQLLERLRSLGVAMPHATGGRPGSSPYKHLQPHLDNRYFYLTDMTLVSGARFR